jgi:hypothetical protein
MLLVPSVLGVTAGGANYFLCAANCISLSALNWTRRRSTFPRVKFLLQVFPNPRSQEEESSVWRHENGGNACCEAQECDRCPYLNEG